MRETLLRKGRVSLVVADFESVKLWLCKLSRATAADACTVAWE
jgi:hypothetical protein